MTPAAIFFDLDDTLLDDTGAQSAYLADLFTGWRHRLPHTDAAGFTAAWRTALDHHFERHVRGELSFLEQRRARIRDVFAAPLGDEDCDALIRQFLDVYEASWRLFDDVLPALDALAHLPLGVITNGVDHQQRQKLETAGIADRFRVIVTSDATKLSKPDPRIFHHAAAAMGVGSEKCVHVGDDWSRDVEGATAAGFRPIWLVRSRGASDLPLGAITRIQSLKSFAAYVEGGL